ncbi:MAG: choice-of-anchor Q domain-containing protein [Candidatus Thiodiazotropha sp. 6PLUC2]
MIRLLHSITLLLIITLLVACGGGEGSSDNSVQSANIPPQADAGADQTVIALQSVTMTGSGSDSDGVVVGYQWTQLSGSSVDLSGAETEVAIFNAPSVAESVVFEFTLTITDDDGAVNSDWVSITVNPDDIDASPNIPPQADAGADQTVNALQSVTLMGNGIDSDGTIVSYQWTQFSGTPIALSGADTAIATFNVPSLITSEILVFILSVTDDEGATTSDRVSISINPNDTEPPTNILPEANAGIDQTVVSLQDVTLTGSGSDSDGSVDRYQWTQLSGSAVNLSGGDTAIATFNAPAVVATEILEFMLTVTDDDGETSSDSINVTINPIVSALLPTFGPDLNQCPATLVDHGVAVVHICDCQAGADSGCESGDDANSGSASNPIRSITAAVASFNSGSGLAFCRGGVWHTDSALALDASSCDTSSPCSIQDYGDATQARPTIKITQSGHVNGLSFDTHSDLERWEGVRIHNLHISKQNQDGEGFGLFLFRNLNDVAMHCIEVDGFGIGVHLNSNGLESGDVTLSDSYMHDNGGMGWLGGTNRTLLERNRFHNNGWLNASMFLHNVYLSQMRRDSIVRGNWLSDSAVDANGHCVGAGLVAHNDNSTNLLIENNLIEESNPSAGCWGLTVDAAGSTTESHYNAIIRGNVIRNVGNLSIGISSCVDCIIENNIVVQTIFGGAIGIASPNRLTAAPDVDVSGTVVRNNSVYFGGSASGRAYYVGERGSNYVVTNNIGYFANTQAGDSCYDFDLSASAYNMVNSNLCYGASFDSGTTGLDGMASTGNPLFINAPDDLRLNSVSPARDAGSSISYPAIDILGNARDGTPDLGAYETP